MEFNKPLSRAGYFLSALLVLTPFVDAVQSTWPPRFGDERWRFGAVGALSGLLLIPLLGLVIALFISAASDHRRVRRFIGTVASVLAIIDGVLLVLFILDYFQTRTIVRPQFQHSMSVATTTAAIKHVAAVISLGLISHAGFSGPRPLGSRKDDTVRASASASNTPIILGADPRS